MRKLILDIETRPNLAYVWGLWKQDINIKQIVEHTDVLCLAAKWHGDPDHMFFRSPFHHGRDRMIYDTWQLLDSADAVIHYNGKQFDMPKLNSMFLDVDMLPYSPVAQIDLLETVRRKFGYASNKLDYVADHLGLGSKVDTGGMQTWIGCMNNDPDAWARMREYNIHDVLLTEKLYDRLLPWIDRHPSEGAFNGDDSCPNCHGKDLLRKGFAFLKSGKYQRYVCNDCGKHSRATKRFDKTQIVEAI
jgi:uncharacterized protein